MRMNKLAIGIPLHNLGGDRRATTIVERAIRAMHRVLHEVGWIDRPEGEERRIHVDFGAPRLPITKLLVAIDPESKCFIACFDFELSLAAECMERLLRFVARANAGLLSGSFDVDLSQQTMHFRTGVVFGAGELGEELIRATLRAALSVINAHADPLKRVVDGCANPDDAIAMAWTTSNRTNGDAKSS